MENANENLFKRLMLNRKEGDPPLTAEDMLMLNGPRSAVSVIAQQLVTASISASTHPQQESLLTYVMREAAGKSSREAVLWLDQLTNVLVDLRVVMTADADLARDVRYTVDDSDVDWFETFAEAVKESQHINCESGVDNAGSVLVIAEYKKVDLDKTHFEIDARCEECRAWISNDESPHEHIATCSHWRPA